MSTASITEADVKAAADRIADRVRHVTITPADPGTVPGTDALWLACEFMQHGGSSKPAAP